MTFLDLLPWWTYAIATFGVLGVVAIVLLAPALGAVILNQIMNGVAAMLRTPMGAAMLAGAVCLVLGYFGGALHTKSQCNDRIVELRAQGEEDRKAMEETIAAELAQQYAPVIAELTKNSDDLQKQVDDYASTVKATAQCRLGDEPLRLRVRNKKQPKPTQLPR